MTSCLPLCHTESFKPEGASALNLRFVMRLKISSFSFQLLVRSQHSTAMQYFACQNYISTRPLLVSKVTEPGARMEITPKSPSVNSYRITLNANTTTCAGSLLQMKTYKE